MRATPPMSRNTNRLRDQSGFAMAGLMIAILLLVVFSSFSVQQTALDQRSTSHADTGNRALFAAESGILHALNTMNASGVIDFKEDVSDRWSTIFGTSAIDLVSDPNSDYRIVVTPDTADPVNRGTITATGRGPLLARRVIQVDVAKGGFVGGPGAIHLADPGDVDANFVGDAFEVDGNNHDRFGNLANDGIVKPAFSALTPENVNEVTDSLNSRQVDNVRGLGFDPVTGTPSVSQTGGPDNDGLDQFVADILARPDVQIDSRRNLNGNSIFGTVDNPQITYLSDPDARLTGSAQGAGILIADGSIIISGTLDFVGLVIVRGDTIINAVSSPDDDTIVLGDAFVMGSLWTGNLQITVGGSAIVDYCHECLWLVDQGVQTNSLIPRPMRIVSWRDL